MLIISCWCRHNDDNGPLSNSALIRASIVTPHTAPPDLRDAVAFINTITRDFDFDDPVVRAHFPEFTGIGTFLNDKVVYKRSAHVTRARNAQLITHGAPLFHAWRALQRNDLQNAYKPFKVFAVPTYLAPYRGTDLATDPIDRYHYAVIEPRIDTSLMDQREVCDGGKPPATQPHVAEQLISALMIANVNDIHNGNIIPQADGSLIIVDLETLDFYDEDKDFLAQLDEYQFVCDVDAMYRHSKPALIKRLLASFEQHDKQAWLTLTPEERNSMAAPQHPRDKQWHTLKERCKYFFNTYIKPSDKPLNQTLSTLESNGILTSRQAAFFAQHIDSWQNPTPSDEEKQALIDAMMFD